MVVLDFVTDQQRVAELVELERASRNRPLVRIARLHLISFRDARAGDLPMESERDQADLLLRSEAPSLQMPRFEFPG